MLSAYVLAQAVAAASPEAAAQQGVISYPASFFTPYQTANAAEMVQRIPGFSLDTGASVRGFEGAAGNVLIDGQRPSSKTDDLDSILRRIPTSRVERIDVIRGGAPGIDMQGKTVIANVIRKQGGGLRGLAAFSQNHTHDGRTAFATRLEASGELGRSRWEISSFAGKGVDEDGAGEGVRVGFDGRRTDTVLDTEGDGLNGFVTGSFETPLFGGEARINGRIASDKFKYEEDNRILSTPPSLETTDDVQQTEDVELGGNFTRKLGPKTTLELVGLRRTSDRTLVSRFTSLDGDSIFDLDRESSESIGRAVLKYTVSPKLSVEGGGEYAINTLDSVTALTESGAPVDLPAASVRVQEDRYEVFTKAAWRPFTRWTVDASLRFESSQITSRGDVVLSKKLQFLKPRLTAAWDARPTTQVRLRLEREVGQLNFNDFVASASLNTAAGVSAGNPDLDPEQAWVAEIALEQRFWERGSLVLTARHKELKDVVDRGPVFSSDGVFDRPANIGDGTRDEIRAEITLPLDRLGVRGAQLKANTTRLWSHVTDPTTMTSRRISGRRHFDWNVSYNHDVASWRLSYGVDVFGGFRQTSYRFNYIEIAKNRTYVQPYLEWRPAPDINIRFEMPNATSRDYRRTLILYPGPRSQPGAPGLDDRLIKPERSYYFRVRKTFGG